MTRPNAVLVVGVVLLLIAAPGVAGLPSVAAQSTPTVTIDTPDSVDADTTAESPLVVQNVGDNDDVGAFELNIMYNESALSIDASDTDGNSLPYSIQNTTLSVTQAPTDGTDGDDGDDGGGGGGGAGGGGAGADGGDEPTPEPESTVSKPSPNQVAVAITNLSANSPAEVTLPSTDVDNTTGTQLTGLSVTSRVSTNVNVSIDRSESVPGGAPSVEDRARGGAFGYFEITADVSDDDLEGARYTFQVSKSRLEDAAVTSDEVVLFRLNEDEQDWTALETSVVEERDEAYVFAADSPGFSVYAIGYSEVQETTTATTASTTAEQTTAAGTEETTVPGTTTETTTPIATGDSPVSAVIVLAVLLLAVVAVYVYRRR